MRTRTGTPASGCDEVRLADVSRWTITFDATMAGTLWSLATPFRTFWVQSQEAHPLGGALAASSVLAGQPQRHPIAIRSAHDRLTGGTQGANQTEG